MTDKIVYGMSLATKEANSAMDQVELLRKLWELGITRIDTANIYGEADYHQAHKLLGEAFMIDPSLKSKFRVVTKCGLIEDKQSEVLYYNSEKEYIIEQVKTSLNDLNLRQLDTILLHHPDLFIDFEEVYQGFKYLKEQEMVKHFGVVNYSSIQFKALSKYLRQRGINLRTNQIEIASYPTQHYNMDNLFYLKGEGIKPMIQVSSDENNKFSENQVINQIANDFGLNNLAVVVAFLNNQGLNAEIIINNQVIADFEIAIDALDLTLNRQQMYQILNSIK